MRPIYSKMAGKKKRGGDGFSFRAKKTTALDKDITMYPSYATPSAIHWDLNAKVRLIGIHCTKTSYTANFGLVAGIDGDFMSIMGLVSLEFGTLWRPASPGDW